MSLTPANRLRLARTAAGFKSARKAAMALGIPQATYVQHENGKRAFTISQGERYSAFFNGAKIVDHFLAAQLTIPDREALACLIFDTVNKPLHFSDAPDAIAQAYREAVDAVFVAFGPVSYTHLRAHETPEHL